MSAPMDAPVNAPVKASAPAPAPLALERLPDWRGRLAAYLGEARARPFAWGGRGGGQDCAVFAGGAVEAQTGVDLMRGWRGYRTPREASRRLREAGFEGHVARVAALLPECPPLLARPGDLVVLADDALAVCQGRLAYAVGPEGMVGVDMEEARRGFRVGEA